ncbi:hypothetical protein DFP73DRAFT_109540 [Morchella snyderi]|nr:hypothetical protein DFP73DRAFT_109540 [Morchella snyderi]
MQNFIYYNNGEQGGRRQEQYRSKSQVQHGRKVKERQEQHQKHREICGDMELDGAAKAEIKDAFTIFDMDKDGLIDYHELQAATKALGFRFDKQELVELLQQQGVTANERGSQHRQSSQIPSGVFINRESFNVYMTTKFLNRDPSEEISRAFELFTGAEGADKAKKITFDDLARVASELQDPSTDEELRAMIDEFDDDNDDHNPS